MIEVIFLGVLAVLWMIFASVQDFKHREIANWLNFSLIVFALGFRFFYCLFAKDFDFSFFYQGLIGFGIFFAIGNLLYYTRLFAGGDAKLMIALGAILPLSENLYINLKLFLLFLLIFFFVGAVYGFIFSLVLSFKNLKRFNKEFLKQISKQNKLLFYCTLAGILISLCGFFELFFLFIGIFVLVIPTLYLFAKAVEESCMVKYISTKDLREGDWLYKSVRIGKKKINFQWEGLNNYQIKEIRKKYKTVMIKEGIAFAPVFLISFLILLYTIFYLVLF